MVGSALFAVAAVLFCLRDARVIAIRPTLAWLFVPLALGVSVGCGLLAENLSEAEAQAWLDDFRMWGPAVSLHIAAGLWGAVLARRERLPDWTTVVPGAVVVVGAVGAMREALISLDDATGLVVGLAVGGAYVVLACGLTAIVGTRQGARATVRLAALVHIAALTLIPIQPTITQTVPLQAVDWPATAVVLSAVCLLVAGSCALHRRRYRRHSTAGTR